MYNTQMITELREIAKEVEELRARAKGKVAAYYEGSRDILLQMAAMYERRCPLAVLFFNSPVIVTKEA